MLTTIAVMCLSVPATLLFAAWTFDSCADVEDRVLSGALALCGAASTVLCIIDLVA